jgi:orotate phosphoribosyltransferase
MTIEDLKKYGALLEGHFLLSSGLHSNQYIQCAKLLQTIEGKSKVIEALYHNEDVLQFEDVDVVIGGAYGGIRIASIIAWWIGNTLTKSHNPRGIWCERELKVKVEDIRTDNVVMSKYPSVVSGKFQLRRGFEIKEGEKVLIAEDVTTTGKSIGEVAELVKEHGGEIVGAISIIDRRKEKTKYLSFFAIELISLIQLDIPICKPEECPLCKKICENCKFKGNCTLEGGGKAMKNCGWQPKYPLQKLGSK